MELFYNPERMSETEIRETFVANQWLVDEIISIVKKQPKGAAVQHVVIVAPRGMGKTTLLLMLRLTVQNHDIAKRWQPVLFPEESYSVYDLADLWVEVLDHLASETGESELRDEVEKLKTAHPDSADLEPLALAQIKDWHRKHKKRLLMLVDSLDLILEQIGDEKDNASLRHVLMNDGTMMFVGGSTTFFKEARAYDQPLYNFFKIYNLNGLNSDQIEDLLRRRAKIDGLENFEEILRANRTRLRVLEYFTGGNPRLVLMLYRVITQSQIGEVRRGLEKLLDEVTPYYKAKIETLPPQQRKILDQIARISAQTREGLTPTEIAAATRLAVNQVSSQLKRLADDGYVRAANIRGRSSYYTLSEPLYAIWHQMRFGRDARMKMNWLVTFLKGWYDAKELGEECQRLEDLFSKYLNAGLKREARNALEHRRYLTEAIDDQPSRARSFEGVILGYLELSDVDTLQREILGQIDINLLSAETCQRLSAAGLLREGASSPESEQKVSRAFNQAEFKSAVELARAEFKQGRYKDATNAFDTLENSLPDDSPMRFIVRYEKAFLQDDQAGCVSNLEQFIQQRPDDAAAWYLKGVALCRASQFEDAIESLKRALEIEPSYESWHFLGDALDKVGRTEEALLSFEEAIRNRPESAPAWYQKGRILLNVGKLKEALQCLDRATELNPTSYTYLFAKTLTLHKLGKTAKVLRCVDDLLELDPNSADAYFLKAAQFVLTDFDRAIIGFQRAFASDTSSHRILIDSVPGKSVKLILSVLANEVEQSKADWQELMRCASLRPKGDWVDAASATLRFLAQAGHWSLARDLISKSDLEEPLFPLARALDYLLEGDEGSIERLSPEIKNIVGDIVGTLESSSLRKMKKTVDPEKKEPRKTKRTKRTNRNR